MIDFLPPDLLNDLIDVLGSAAKSSIGEKLIVIFTVYFLISRNFKRLEKALEKLEIALTQNTARIGNLEGNVAKINDRVFNLEIKKGD